MICSEVKIFEQAASRRQRETEGQSAGLLDTRRYQRLRAEYEAEVNVEEDAFTWFLFHITENPTNCISQSH